MSGLWNDLLLGVRRLVREPRLSGMVVFCLALGIGGNSLVFTMIHATLLAPLPYPEAERIVTISDTYEGQSHEVSPPNYAAREEEAESFAAIAAIQLRNLNLAFADEPLRVESAAVSAGFFDVFATAPVIGRAFAAEEDRRAAAAPVAILSHSLWQNLFSGDPGVLGESVVLDSSGFTVIGVMPRGFSYPSGTQVWVPLGLDSERAPQRFWHNIFAVARLGPEATEQSAQTELTALACRMEEAYPDTNGGWGAQVLSLHEYLVGDQRATLISLQGAGAFFLLLVCANVASLLLVRAIRRSGELALRSALGAGRWPLVRQALVESLLLSLLGGVIGLGLTALSLGSLLALVPPQVGNLGDVGVDTTVVLFTFALAFLCGLIAGVLPALRTVRADVNSLLQGGLGRSAGVRTERRVQSFLVVAEVAVTAILLVAAGSMIRSFQKLQAVDTNFETSNLLSLQISLPDVTYPDIADRSLFTRRLLERVREVPGVEAAGTSNVLPFDPRPVQALFSVRGRPPKEPGEMLITKHRLVSPGYLGTLGLPIEGRDFTELDDMAALADGGGAVVVSEELARIYWGDQDPLGQQVKRGNYESANPWLTVVGVVPDLRDVTLDQREEATWYLPSSQHRFRYLRLLVRTRANPESLAGPVREVVQELDSQLPVHDVATMEQLVGSTIVDRRLSTVILALFALLSLVLAQIGIYGLLSYSVANRQKEISIRLALGAVNAQVRNTVVGQGMRLAAIGLAIGLIGALALHRFLTHLLFEVEAGDPLTLLLVFLCLALVALLGSGLPAWRASRTLPAQGLRQA